MIMGETVLDYFIGSQGCRFVPQKQAATDGRDLNIGETRVWRLDSGRNLQPWFMLDFF